MGNDDQGDVTRLFLPIKHTLDTIVVDIEQKIMVVGAELHADEELFLLEQGSQQEYLWGINIHPNASQDEFIEFDSMINIRPSMGNRSRFVHDEQIRKKITTIVHDLVKP